MATSTSRFASTPAGGRPLYRGGPGGGTGVHDAVRDALSLAVLMIVKAGKHWHLHIPSACHFSPSQHLIPKPPSQPVPTASLTFVLRVPPVGCRPPPPHTHTHLCPAGSAGRSSPPLPLPHTHTPLSCGFRRSVVASTKATATEAGPWRLSGRSLGAIGCSGGAASSRFRISAHHHHDPDG